MGLSLLAATYTHIVLGLTGNYTLVVSEVQFTNIRFLFWKIIEIRVKYIDLLIPKMPVAWR